MANSMRTEQAHLPFPLRKNLSVDALRERARETGPKAFEVIRRMFDESKVKEQPMQTARAILSIADIYSSVTIRSSSLMNGRIIKLLKRLVDEIEA